MPPRKSLPLFVLFISSVSSILPSSVSSLTSIASVVATLVLPLSYLWIYHHHEPATYQAKQKVSTNGGMAFVFLEDASLTPHDDDGV